MTRVFILGRVPAERDRLRASVASADIVVVGAAGSLPELIAAWPDVAILADDEALRGAGRAALPPVVLWTDEPGAAARVRRSGVGAWGVVARGAAPRQLQAAVLAVANGLCVIPAFSAGPAILEGVRDADDEQDPVELAEPLTPRERDVLEAASRGLSNRDIGEALGISEHTVKFHLAATYGKLGVSTRTAAVRRGLRRGIIEI